MTRKSERKRDTRSWEIDRTVIYRFSERMSRTRLVISAVTEETQEISINEVSECLYFRSAQGFDGYDNTLLFINPLERSLFTVSAFFLSLVNLKRLKNA